MIKRKLRKYFKSVGWLIFLSVLARINTLWGLSILIDVYPSHPDVPLWVAISVVVFAFLVEVLIVVLIATVVILISRGYNIHMGYKKTHIEKNYD